MKLSIITINFNNVAGLEKTILSVASQSFKEFEYVVVDGASTDGSVEGIKKYESMFPYLKWVSEPDTGIYNAMNKGVRMASGNYVQILNSGDCLAADDVIERMLAALENSDNPSILYGNMIKCFPDGRKVIDKCFAGQEITMLGMYSGTLNHDPVFIRRDLFEKYGYYDESLRIVSDWKWYLQAIILGDETPQYIDLDVTLYDMTGISEDTKWKERIYKERQEVLEKEFPAACLRDYERYSGDIYMMRRIHRHPWSFKLVRFLERCLFKMEKRKNRKKSQQIWG